MLPDAKECSSNRGTILDGSIFKSAQKVGGPDTFAAHKVEWGGVKSWQVGACPNNSYEEIQWHSDTLQRHSNSIEPTTDFEHKLHLRDTEYAILEKPETVVYTSDTLQ